MPTAALCLQSINELCVAMLYRYYPVRDRKNTELFRKYKALADKEDGVTFVGGLANYEYFEMDQTIRNALDIFQRDTGIATREKGRT